MKKIKITIFVLVILIAFLAYYITLPAVNVHAASFWWFLLGALMLLAGVAFFRDIKKQGVSVNAGVLELKAIKVSLIVKILTGMMAFIALFFLGGSILSSPFINASKYQSLLTVTERDFKTDIKEADYNTIPLLDKSSATILGNRKMGSMVEMVSQFEVAPDYTQINFNDKPVRVTPLVYASGIKWLTNQADGIPAYLMIDMTTQDTEVVQLEEGIKYSKSELFNRNIYRHLRFNYPTYIFDDQIFFEIDEEGVPFWVCPVKKYNIGLFGGQTVGNVVLCNAVTGECTDYPIAEVPQWIDKAYSAELLVQLYDYHGVLINGYWNSVLGQKDCLQTTNGYNYLAIEDDVWVYTGVTSVSGDQSNVGFVLMNQRTMETRFYRVEGAIEDSAMSSAEGQVQNLGYQAAFPLLVNIAGEPTYFMALKDDSGLVKKYAMVNVEKYQWVAIGDTVKDGAREYKELLNTNGIVSELESRLLKTSGVISSISPVVIEGTTHYYVCIEGSEEIFDLDLSDQNLIGIVRFLVGDRITLEYVDELGLKPVRNIS